MNFGLQEWLLVIFIALILFGPRKLPEIGKALGAGINEFKKAMDGRGEPKQEVSTPDQPGGGSSTSAPSA